MKKTDKTAETMSYAKMGMAAVLPGMVHMLELMQAEVDRFRQQLAAMQDGEEVPAAAPEKSHAARARKGWPIDPVERQAEAQRRQAVKEQNKKLKAARAKRKESWDAQPAKVKKARLAAMAAGRKAKRQPAWNWSRWHERPPQAFAATLAVTDHRSRVRRWSENLRGPCGDRVRAGHAAIAKLAEGHLEFLIRGQYEVFMLEFEFPDVPEAEQSPALRHRSAPHGAAGGGAAMIVLSNRQYPMVQAFVDMGEGYMDIETAQRYDQRPFRSLLIRKWVAFRPGHGFHLTPRGPATHGAITMPPRSGGRTSTLPLTAYFDVTAYKLKVAPKRAAGRAA